jgi:hypothetical protein
MIKGNEKLSETAARFYQLPKKHSPDLLRFATVGSPSDKYPYAESDSIVIVIPARDGFLFEEIYLETSSVSSID